MIAEPVRARGSTARAGAPRGLVIDPESPIISVARGSTPSLGHQVRAAPPDPASAASGPSPPTTSSSRSAQAERVEDALARRERLVGEHGERAPRRERVRSTSSDAVVGDRVVQQARRRRSRGTARRSPASIARPAAVSARRTSTRAPSPTIRPIASSVSGVPPRSAISWLAESARSRRESIERAVEIEDDQRGVGGPRGRRFPDGDTRDRQAVLARDVEDQPRDALGGRIAVEQVHRLAERLQQRRRADRRGAGSSCDRARDRSSPSRCA